MLCKLKSCHKCSGDLVMDGDEWRCWQCGQHYYPGLSMAQVRKLMAEVPISAKNTQPSGRHGPRSVRKTNLFIGAIDRSDERWWQKNEEVIRYLDEGLTLIEISRLVGRGLRQISEIRGRLNDLRSAKD